MDRIRFTQNLGKTCACVHLLFFSSARAFGEPGNEAKKIPTTLWLPPLTNNYWFDCFISRFLFHLKCTFYKFIKNCNNCISIIFNIIRILFCAL